RKHGHIETVRRLIEEAPFHSGFSFAHSSDHAVTAALQKYRRILQCELNVLAHSIIQIDLWHVDRALIRSTFKYSRTIVFPITVSRRSGIIGDHRRSTLPKCDAHRICETHRNRKSSPP